MRRLPILTAWALLTFFCPTNASSDDALDKLLPTPFWLRSRADELNIDAATKKRIEDHYKAAEPKYHAAKKKVADRTRELHKTLGAEKLDQARILKQMQALLDAETELKLYQVRVRLKLLALLSAKQLKNARELVKRKPKGDFRKVLADKVARVRQLGKRVKDRGGSIADVEKRMKDIEKLIATGKILQGARMLDQVIRDLEKRLAKPRDE